MKYKDYINRVEEVISDLIGSHHPRAWSEDTISEMLCKEFVSKLSINNIQGLVNPMSIKWDAFKLKGKLEHAHGDIAILVRYISSDNEKIEGVGLLEAKKRYINSNCYEAIKWEQLQRQIEFTRHAFLLLYDYDPIIEYRDNIVFQQYSMTKIQLMHKTLESNAVVLQSDLALQIRKEDKSLYKYSFPLSHQICHRFLRGMDLERQDSVLTDVRGFADKNLGGVKYILLATIVMGQDQQVDSLKISSANDETYINLQRYVKITPDTGQSESQHNDNNGGGPDGKVEKDSEDFISSDVQQTVITSQ